MVEKMNHSPESGGNGKQRDTDIRLRSDNGDSSHSPDRITDFSRYHSEQGPLQSGSRRGSLSSGGKEVVLSRSPEYSGRDKDHPPDAEGIAVQPSRMEKRGEQTLRMRTFLYKNRLYDLSDKFKPFVSSEERQWLQDDLHTLASAERDSDRLAARRVWITQACDNWAVKIRKEGTQPGWDIASASVEGQLESARKKHGDALRGLKFWVNKIDTHGIQSYKKDGLQKFVQERENHYKEIYQIEEDEIEVTTEAYLEKMVFPSFHPSRKRACLAFRKTLGNDDLENIFTEAEKVLVEPLKELAQVEKKIKNLRSEEGLPEHKSSTDDIWPRSLETMRVEHEDALRSLESTVEDSFAGPFRAIFDRLSPDAKGSHSFDVKSCVSGSENFLQERREFYNECYQLRDEDLWQRITWPSTEDENWQMPLMPVPRPPRMDLW